MSPPVPYRFPGMDPWLEHPSLWGDVHFRLIAALARYLSPLLAPRYYVAVRTHTYVTTPPILLDSVRYPDVFVVETGQAATRQSSTTAQVSEPVLVQVPVPEVIEETYLEVREPATGEVITAVELLSPANKRPGLGREQYLRKRLEILATQTHLVEIDLLRSWPPMPFAGAESESHYRILIRRSEEGATARLYAFSIQDTIPRFPLPLQPGDEEPVIDMNVLLQGVYAEGRYDLRVNYAQPPIPPLAPANAEWAAQRLAAIL